MSVNPVDRVSPYPPVPHRDDSAGFARRRGPRRGCARPPARPPLAGDASARRRAAASPRDRLSRRPWRAVGHAAIWRDARPGRGRPGRRPADRRGDDLRGALLSHSGDGAARSLSRDAACARALGEPRAGRRPRLRSPRRGAARPALAVRAARRGDRATRRRDAFFRRSAAVRHRRPVHIRGGAEPLLRAETGRVPPPIRWSAWRRISRRGGRCAAALRPPSSSPISPCSRPGCRPRRRSR